MISKFGTKKFWRVWVSCSRITTGFSPELLKTWKTAVSMGYNSISWESNDFAYTRTVSVSFKCYAPNIVSVYKGVGSVSVLWTISEFVKMKSLFSRCWKNTPDTWCPLTEKPVLCIRSDQLLKKLLYDSDRYAGRVLVKADDKESNGIIERSNGTHVSFGNWLSNWKAYWLGAWSNQRVSDRMSKWLCEWTIRPVDPALKWRVS